jgi:tetratricopeptide (TPR) repeat protein
MVRDGFGDDSGAKLIEQRGIDFAPSEDFYQTLKAAGASEAFLQAVRTAKRPPATPPSPVIPAPSPKPMAEQNFPLFPQSELPAIKKAVGPPDLFIRASPEERRRRIWEASPSFRKWPMQVQRDFTDALAARFVERGLASKQSAAPAPQPLSETVKKPEGKRPLTQLQVLALLGGEVSSHRVAMLIRDRGIDFEPTDDYLLQVRLAGGDEELIGTLKKTKRTAHLQRCTQMPLDARGVDANGGSSAALAKYHEAEVECRAAEAEVNGIELAAVHEQLGQVLAGQKRWDGAIAEYRESMNLEGEEDSDCHLGIGEALEGKGDLDGAIAEYRLALQVYSSISESEPTTSESTREMFRQIDNNNLSDYHWHLGLALFNKQDLAGAITEFREVVRLNPSNAESHYFLGFLLEKKGDFPAALEEYRTANELDPNNSEAREGFERVKEEARTQDDIKKWRECVQRSPDNPSCHQLLALSLHMAGDLDGEIAEYWELVRLEPTNVENRNLLGLLLVRDGNLDGAIAELKVVLRQKPDWDPAHLSICRALDQKGDLDGALAQCREAVRLCPQCSDYRAALGDVLYHKHDIDGAIAEYREANRLFPGSPEKQDNELGTVGPFPGHHTGLGNLLTWKGDWKGAADEFRKAIVLDPDDDEAHHGLGLALEHQGDRKSALAEYRKACDLDPDNHTYQGDYDRLAKAVGK